MIQKFLIAFVFVTGAAVTAIEITAARLLAPYFGASLFVWANVIGVVLAALAAGYWLGGKIADRSPKPTTLFTIVLAAGIVTSIIPLAITIIVAVSAQAFLHFSFALIFTSLASSLVLFGIPVLLLGMVSPFAIRLASHGVSDAGRTAGAIFAAGTVGSLVGTFGSAFLTIPFWGARETILLASFLLIAASVVGYVVVRKKILLRSLAVLLPLLMLVVTYPALFRDKSVLAERDSPYQHLRVIEENGTRYLFINAANAVQSVYRPDQVQTGWYYDYFPLLASLVGGGPPQRTLILGLAGGTISRELLFFYPELAGKITGVEIDPEIIKLARQYFALDEQTIDVMTNDARVALRDQRAQNLIIMDLFNQQLSIPVHLATKEFFTETKAHLAPSGILAANVIAENKSSLLLQQFLATLRAVYPHVYFFHIPSSYNFFVVASREPIDVGRLSLASDPSLRALAEQLAVGLEEVPAGGGPVFTDNRSNIELLTDRTFFKILAELRP